MEVMKSSEMSNVLYKNYKEQYPKSLQSSEKLVVYTEVIYLK